MEQFKSSHLSPSTVASFTSDGNEKKDEFDPEGHKKTARLSHTSATLGTDTSQTPRANLSGVYRLSASSSRLTVSRPGHLSVQSDGQSSVFADLRADVTVASLYQEQRRNLYVADWNTAEGVVLKRSRNIYVCQPTQMRAYRDGFFDMISLLNVSAAMTVNTPWVQSIIMSIRTREVLVDSIPLQAGLQLQVLPRMTDLPRCQKHHFAAFIVEPPVLVVWDDDPSTITKRVEGLQADIMALIWGTPREEEEEKGTKEATKEGADLEEGDVPEARVMRVERSAMIGISLALALTCLGLGWRWLALEIMLDGYYLRLLLVIACPVQLFVSMFFFQVIVTNIFQLIGPISSVNSNSRYYSGKPPKRLNRETTELPHVTIQMPVYKEGLNAVIRPTVLSLKAAISTYEMQGGTANIFINDDGMQLVDEGAAEARREFYEENSIGWVSRPKHNPKPEGENERPFVRKGKFKKASNMNYCLMTSNKVEEKLQAVVRTPRWTQMEEEAAYAQCLEEVVQESEGRTWAGGNIRVGDYILLVDSDTRVPKDCLLDAVSEMEQSPEVAIIQHTSGVMTVTDSFFEKGVTWFTYLIYTAITFAVANGDICPFVGHNAILRWRAVQDAAAYTDPDDNTEKYWSESHVSEDFDMALRLQGAGYLLRFATYSNGGFQEGVSLTVYDELARWEKYAYGCNELLFHPLRFWITRGPFAPVFKQFIFSKINFYHKLTILAYIGTYYAIGAGWILVLLNYFLTGWFFGLYDKFYIDSFAVWLSVVVVFAGVGNLALAVLRYRLSEQGLPYAIWNNIRWVPLFTIFLGGLSLHMSKALLCHFFEIDIQWGATSKEAEEVNFLEEVPRILKNFAGTFAFCVLCMALIGAGYYAFPREWRIQTFASIFPLGMLVGSSFCVPVLLNPALMKFTF